MIYAISLGWTQQFYTILVVWIAGSVMLYLLRAFGLLNRRYVNTGFKALTIGCLSGALVYWFTYQPSPETPRVAVFPFQPADTTQAAGPGIVISHTTVDLLRLSLPEGARVMPFDELEREVALADTVNPASVINAGVRLGFRYAVFGDYKQSDGRILLRVRFMDISDSTEVTRKLRIPREDLVGAPVRLVEMIGQEYQVFAAADPSLDLGIHLPPAEAFVYYCQGQTQFQIGTFDSYWNASEAYRAALAIDSTYALPHYGLAQVQHAWQRPESKYASENESMRLKAIDRAKIAVIMNPRLSESYRFMAQVYRSDKRWDEMSTVLQQAITADPQESLNYMRLSMLSPERYQDLGYADEAELAEQAVVLNRDAVLLWEQLMNNYISAGRLRDALRFGRDILEQMPDRIEVLVAAGTAFRYNNRAFEAVDVYRKVIDQEPYNTQYYYYLSEAYAMRQNHAEIVKTFEEGIAKMPDNSELHFYMGVSHQKIGQWVDAVPWFGKAIELDDHLNSHYYMARWYEKQGNRQMAVHHWKKRVTLGDPNEKWTQEATRRLGNLSPSALPGLRSIGASL
ncbi:MAG: hypothetical protein VYA69_02855 [Gemmatimonadota bacterium]|nr:hypothetical protein [Gemmatimonadota bacterium]